MIVKRPQASLALRFLALTAYYKRKVPMAAEIVEERSAMKAQMHILNKRVPQTDRKVLHATA
jgi:hypothetical protein